MLYPHIVQRTKKSLVQIIAVLMFVSSAIYFYAAYDELSESNDASAQIQSMFFATSGIVFLPLGGWMLKNRLHSRAPYVISMIVALSLIIFYVASRLVQLPVVGIQDDVGPIDILSKVIQGGIFVISVLLLPYLKREQTSILKVV